MLETSLVNRDMVAELAKMGHTDKLLIADAGLAIPNTTKVIDLSLKENVPTALDVLKIILEHFSVEKVILSDAIEVTNPKQKERFIACLPEGVIVEIVPQDFLRNNLTREVKFAIRTGDFTANSNIVLISAGGPRWFSER